MTAFIGTCFHILNHHTGNRRRHLHIVYIASEVTIMQAALLFFDIDVPGT